MIGAGAVLVFAVVRGVNGYGDPVPWSAQRSGLFTALSWLNCSRYPPSLLFVLTTLGPAIVLSLPVVYAVWVAALVAMYPGCKRYANVKRTSRRVWSSYL